jgi:hypothetical protein
MISNNSLNTSSFHRMNMIIWDSILAGIAIITIFVYILDQIRISRIIETGLFFHNIPFLTAIALAFIILILKRSIFLPANIVHRVMRENSLNRELLLMNRIRRNYIIVWSLGELICIAGFIDFLMFLRFKSFLVYLIVSVYSILINIPKLSKLEKSLELLNKIKEDDRSI